MTGSGTHPAAVRGGMCSATNSGLRPLERPVLGSNSQRSCSKKMKGQDGTSSSAVYMSLSYLSWKCQRWLGRLLGPHNPNMFDGWQCHAVGCPEPLAVVLDSFGPCAKMFFHLGSDCSSCIVSYGIVPRNEKGLRYSEYSLVKQHELSVFIEQIWTLYSPRHCMKHLRSKVCCWDLEIKPKPRKSNGNAQKFFLDLRTLWNGNLLPQTLVFDAACWIAGQFLTETAFCMNASKSVFVARNLTNRNDYESGQANQSISTQLSWDQLTWHLLEVTWRAPMNFPYSYSRRSAEIFRGKPASV
jgi:hypothetical protein